MAVDWLKIKSDYINGGGSYRKLAESYGVNKDTIAARAKAENWKALRAQQADKIHTKTIQKVADEVAEQEAQRIVRLLGVSDQLAARIEQAISELDQTQVTHKTKTRTLEYNADNAPGKPTKEIVAEEERVLAVASIVDRKGLQQIASALKNVWEIARDGANSEPGESDGDGLLDALANNAESLFIDGDDSGMLPEEKE